MPNATMGDGWRGFFEHWSSDGTLRPIDHQADRKRPYEGSIVGDWTLRLSTASENWLWRT